MTEQTPAARRWLTPLHAPARWVLALAATLAAAAHLPVIPEHLREARYMGVLFVLLTAACLLLAVTVIIADAPVAYGATAIVCALAVIGYAATRMVAFPPARRRRRQLARTARRTRHRYRGNRRGGERRRSMVCGNSTPSMAAHPMSPVHRRPTPAVGSPPGHRHGGCRC